MAAVSSVVLLVLGSLASCAMAATVPRRTASSSSPVQTTSSLTSGTMTSRELRVNDRSTLTSNAAPAQMASSTTTPSATMTSRDLQTPSSSVFGSSIGVTTLHDIPHLTDLSIPPEVITEALFSQIDLVQDLLEQCEETARNGLNGDSSQESVDMGSSGNDDVDNSQEIASAASFLLRGSGHHRDPTSASPRHAGARVPASQLAGEHLLPTGADEEERGNGGDDVISVSNVVVDLGSERRHHSRHSVDDGNGDNTYDDDPEEGYDHEDNVQKKGDGDRARGEIEDGGGKQERKVTSGKVDIRDGATTTTTVRTSATSSKNDSAPEQNDSFSPRFAHEIISDPEESSGEGTLLPTAPSMDKLGAGGYRTKRSVTLMKEEANVISEGERENKATSGQRGKSQIRRFERNTIILKNENSFSPIGQRHSVGKSKTENSLIAVRRAAQRIQFGRRLRKLLGEEQHHEAEKEYGRTVLKARPRDHEDLEAAVFDEGRSSKLAVSLYRPSHDPKTRKAKLMTSSLKLSDSWQRRFNRWPVLPEAERLLAGIARFTTSSRAERRRVRRNADQEIRSDPERFAPLIGHLIERLDYLKRSLAECHVLLDSEQWK